MEQGAFSGNYDTTHPFHAGSDRAAVYNPVLPEIEKLNKVIKMIADKHNVGAAQIPVAWTIAKGTLPIVGGARRSLMLRMRYRRRT